MTEVLIVALHGPAMSGKDTAAKMLRWEADPRVAVRELRFAEPIYQMIRTRVPEARSEMSKEEKERLRPELGGLSIRQMAIAIGEGARRYRDDSWVQIALNQLADQLRFEAAAGHHVLVLVPDLRKAAEVEGLVQATSPSWAGQHGVAARVRLVVAHIQPINAPQTGQYDAATETPLPFGPHSVRVVNDHAKGLFSYAASLFDALRVYDFEILEQFLTEKPNLHRAVAAAGLPHP